MAEDHFQERSSETIRRFEAKVREGCRRCGLGEWRGPLLAGFSGGADSAALLLSLSSLFSGGERWPSSLTAIHVHHGLRAEAADRDAAHAESFCAARGIPFLKTHVTVDEKGPGGLEAAAREARRGAFLQAAAETGARGIALAHTLDDQAETVLMRLFEGAGPRGLSGIRPRTPLGGASGGSGLRTPDASNERGIILVRPLLGVSREEILAYLGAREEEWVEDETNADESRLRNLIRRRILPVIRENMGADVIGRIAGSAAHSAGAAEALDAAADAAREAFLFEEEKNYRIGPLEEVGRLPRSVRAGLWERALQEALGMDRRIPLERLIESLDHLALEGGPSAEISLPGNMAARREYGVILLGSGEERAPIPQDEIPLAIPGRTIHPGMRVEVEAFYAKEFNDMCENFMSVALDGTRFRGAPVLRARRSGDRFHPPGAPGERKLKEYLIDRKVPLRERDFIPLLACGQEITWAVGHAASEKYLARPGEGEMLILKARFLPESPEI